LPFNKDVEKCFTLTNSSSNCNRGKEKLNEQLLY